MLGTDAIRWVTTEEEAEEVEDEEILSVSTVVAMSDPTCKRFFYRYAMAADQLRKTRPDIKFYALNVEDYPDLEWHFQAKNIPYPYHSYGPEGECLFFNDDNTDIVEKVLDVHPGSDAGSTEDSIAQFRHSYHWHRDHLALYFYKDPKDLAKVLPTLETLKKAEETLGRAEGRVWKTFVTVDVNTSEREHGLDVDPQKAPYFVLEERDGPTYGVYNPSEEAIKQFFEDYNAGKLKPSFRSEPVPKEISAPMKLVAYNLDETLKDTSKSFFIRYHKDSLEYSKTRSSREWECLAKYCASKPDVVIAELDLVLNTVDATRGLYYYPAGDFNATREVIKYPYSEYLPDFKTFVDMGGKPCPWVPDVAATSLSEFLATHDKVVVDKHSSFSEFPFAEAATILRESHPEIHFIRVNYNEEDKWDGTKLYNKGEIVEKSSDLNLMQFILQSFDNLSIVKDESEWNALCDSSLPCSKATQRANMPLVVQFNSSESPVFSELACAYRHDFHFVQLDSSLNVVFAERYHTVVGDNPMWMVVYPESYSDVRVYSGNMERSAFEEFLRNERVPLVYDFSRYKAKTPPPGQIRAFYFYQEKDEIEPLRKGFEKLASKYPQLAFGYDRISALEKVDETKYLRHCNKSVFVIKDSQSYVLDPLLSSSNPSPEAIADFVEDYNVGKLKPFTQPEKWPLCERGGLTELNELNIKDVLADTSKDAIIWFYGWQVEKFPQLNSLAKHFAGDSNVIVGRVNISSNEIDEQFPWSFDNSWLIMYPANGEIREETGLRKPLVYDGPENIRSLTNFVTTKSPVFELTAETYHSFVEGANWAIIKLYHSSSPSLEDDAAAYEYMFQNQESELLVAQMDLDKEQCVDEVKKSTSPLEFEGKLRENIRLIRK
ncbi:hypothetical protein DICA3_E11628 [Diutina catenulata]